MIKRIYLKALSNGFLVEVDDHNYKETLYAFSTWGEVVEWVKANPATVATPEQDASNVPSSAPISI